VPPGEVNLASDPPPTQIFLKIKIEERKGIYQILITKIKSIFKKE
jgi:hypothetical protein